MIVWLLLTIVTIVLFWRIGATLCLHWPAARTHLTVTLAVIAVGIVLSPIYYEFPGTEYTPATYENGRIVYHPFGLFCLEAGSQCFNVPMDDEARDPVRVVGGIKFITLNPKIRELSYGLRVSLENPERFFADPQRRQLKILGSTRLVVYDYNTDIRLNRGEYHNWMGEQVLSLTYEFNNAHSRDLEEFYNPLDGEQQAKFNKLVEPWFNERLAEYGLSAKSSGFSIR